MNLEFKYGKKFESNRLKFTLAKLDWYKKFGYIPYIPEEIKNGGDIEEYLEKKYNKKDYLIKIEEIKKEIEKIDKFIENLEEKTNKKTPKKIEVLLTKYGVGGSYNLPNRIILNISGNQINKPLVEVLKHEIIHLVMEEYVLTKKLGHKEKEKLIRDIELSLK